MAAPSLSSSDDCIMMQEGGEDTTNNSSSSKELFQAEGRALRTNQPPQDNMLGKKYLVLEGSTDDALWKMVEKKNSSSSGRPAHNAPIRQLESGGAAFANENEDAAATITSMSRNGKTQVEIPDTNVNCGACGMPFVFLACSEFAHCPSCGTKNVRSPKQQQQQEQEKPAPPSEQEKPAADVVVADRVPYHSPSNTEEDEDVEEAATAESEEEEVAAAESKEEEVAAAESKEEEVAAAESKKEEVAAESEVDAATENEYSDDAKEEETKELSAANMRRIVTLPVYTLEGGTLLSSILGGITGYGSAALAYGGEAGVAGVAANGGAAVWPGFCAGFGAAGLAHTMFLLCCNYASRRRSIVFLKEQQRAYQNAAATGCTTGGGGNGGCSKNCVAAGAGIVCTASLGWYMRRELLSLLHL